MNKIVETTLKLIGAKPTDDPCVYVIPTDEVQDLKKEVNTNKQEETKEEESLDKQPEGDSVSGSLQDDNKVDQQY